MSIYNTPGKLTERGFLSIRTRSCVCHVVIIDLRNHKNSEYVACKGTCWYQVLWKSVKWFRRWNGARRQNRNVASPPSPPPVSLRNTNLLELHVEIKSNTETEGTVLERVSVIYKHECFLRKQNSYDTPYSAMQQMAVLENQFYYGRRVWLERVGRGITGPESCSAEFAWLSLKCLTEQFL